MRSLKTRTVLYYPRLILGGTSEYQNAASSREDVDNLMMVAQVLKSVSK